jgi:hypothetical protein
VKHESGSGDPLSCNNPQVTVVFLIFCLKIPFDFFEGVNAVVKFNLIFGKFPRTVVEKTSNDGKVSCGKCFKRRQYQQSSGNFDRGRMRCVSSTASRNGFLDRYYNKAVLKPTDLVLVCLMPAPRDLEIARLLGWYRIPLRTAPKVVAVDYLAFYQPAAFGERGGQIEFIAQVRGHELTTRGELLKDEENHPRAKEEYFKIQLNGLEKLSQPILADKWKRLTFLYTTGEYLLNAKLLNDLVVQNEEREVLWKSLRERAEHGQRYKTDLPEADIPPEVLMALLGIKELPME